MIFIDGTWLYYQIYERSGFRDGMSQLLGGKDWKRWHEIDWTKLPMVACQALLQDKKSSWSAIMSPNSSGPGGMVQPMPQRPIEVMRVMVYSSMHRDTPEDSYRFQMFQNMRKAGFDVNMKETTGPGEKCVDIQLAVDMLYYATVPDAYDVALLLTGDRDFLPAVIRCRQKGRRIGIVSMRSAASIAFEETPNLKDYDTIWLEDYIDQWARRVDRPIPIPTNKPPVKRPPPAFAATGATANSIINNSSDGQRGGRQATRDISDYILNKVLSEFIEKSNEPLVSSRDIGRYLKCLDVGGKSLLEEIKAVYGGLYQFLTLSDMFLVEADSRWNVRAFWVGLIPENERENGLEIRDEQQNLSEDEKAFLEKYEKMYELDEESYEFTKTDPDPIHGADGIDVTAVKPRSSLTKHKAFDLDEYTVVQLKDMCRENKLPVTGKKSELIERLKKHFSLDLLADDTVMEKVDPSTRMEMLVLEYVKAAGGEASSRDVGRYLAVNKASSERLSIQKGGKPISALQEMKELYGGLLKFIEWSSLCKYGRALSGGTFTVVSAPNAERKLEEKIGSAIMD